MRLLRYFLSFGIQLLTSKSQSDLVFMVSVFYVKVPGRDVDTIKQICPAFSEKEKC